jgi:hypothetical protein
MVRTLFVTLCVSIDINFYNDNNEIMKTILWSVDLRDIIAKTENRIIYEIKYMNIYDINLSTFKIYVYRYAQCHTQIHVYSYAQCHTQIHVYRYAQCHTNLCLLIRTMSHKFMSIDTHNVTHKCMSIDTHNVTHKFMSIDTICV